MGVRRSPSKLKHNPPTCTVPLAQSHLHSPTCTVPLAQSHLHSPTCTVPIPNHVGAAVCLGMLAGRSTPPVRCRAEAVGSLTLVRHRMPRHKSYDALVRCGHTGRVSVATCCATLHRSPAGWLAGAKERLSRERRLDLLAEKPTSTIDVMRVRKSSLSHMLRKYLARVG